MNYDITHCFDFKDDICPEECRLAIEERAFDSGTCDVGPRFFSYAHYQGSDICPLKGGRDVEEDRRFKEDSGSAGKEEEDNLS